MLTEELTPYQLATLTALAGGIIPPDARDDGAAAVNAAPRLAERIATGINRALYLAGIDLAEKIAHEKHHQAPSQLSAQSLHDLLAAIRNAQPAFFKQLRMDVSALYLSDPQVWQKIGFPGPSTQSGGYPDFDRRQVK